MNSNAVFSSYVITDPCVGVKDGTCVEVCPVDCIETTPEEDQFYIDPALCIACEQCVLVCPVDAIYLAHEVPEEWRGSIEKNEEFDKKCEEEHKELSHLAYKAREHWKEFQPTLYKRLKAEGTLEQRLEEAAQRTLNEMDQLMNAGFLDYEAREIVYPRYILLRDENEDEDIPEGENPGLDAIHAGHVAMRKIQDEM